MIVAIYNLSIYQNCHLGQQIIILIFIFLLIWVYHKGGKGPKEPFVNLQNFVKAEKVESSYSHFNFSVRSLTGALE